MTAPDPHSPSTAHAPLTRRALRDARERASRGDVTPLQAQSSASGESSDRGIDSVAVTTQPLPHVADEAPSHPPIFKPPPPPLPRRDLHAVRPVPLTSNPARARHVRRPRVSLTARVGMAAASVLLVSTGASALALTQAPQEAPTAGPALVADVMGSQVSAEQPESATPSQAEASADPVRTAIPEDVEAASLALCDRPAFTAALAAHNDAKAIALAGGGEEFRDAVVDGRASCVSLNDPTRLWVVVDKLRPLEPRTYTPSPLAMPAGMRGLDSDGLRADAAQALTTLAKAAKDAGAGEIALNSGFRSYAYQQHTYGDLKSERGQSAAEEVSARPGFSEHQTGLAGDIVPCTDDGCATLDDLDGTSQGEWIAANSWRYGWVVRYEKGSTDITGYTPEPWHLRYVGVELATAYHLGKYHTLEQFFGLPAAPDYAG